MKTFIILSLFAFNSMAASYYSCPTRFSNIKLTLDGNNSSVSLTEIQTGFYLDYGMLEDKIESEFETSLIFGMTNTRNDLQLSFKAESLKEEPERLFGFARGVARSQIGDVSVKCYKLSGPFNN